MPRPGSYVIHPLWSAHHRPVAQATMLADVELNRPSQQAGFDEVTGRSTYADPAPVWTGPARIQALARAQVTADVGDRQVTIRPYLVALPADVPQVRVNDQVYVVGCDDDPDLIGHVLRVVDVNNGSNIWQRDLTCEDITPTNR